MTIDSLLIYFFCTSCEWEIVFVLAELAEQFQVHNMYKTRKSTKFWLNFKKSMELSRSYSFSCNVIFAEIKWWFVFLWGRLKIVGKNVSCFQERKSKLFISFHERPPDNRMIWQEVVFLLCPSLILYSFRNAEVVGILLFFLFLTPPFRPETSLN